MFAKSKIQKTPKFAARRPQAAFRPNLLIATTPTVAKSDLIENKATSQFLIATKFNPCANNPRDGFVARASCPRLAVRVAPASCRRSFSGVTPDKNAGKMPALRTLVLRASQTARHSSLVTRQYHFLIGTQND